MRGASRLAAVAAVLVVGLISAVDASAGNAFVDRIYTDGWADTLFGDCDTFAPADGSICHETEITVGKETESAFTSPTSAPRNPWLLRVEHIVTAWNGGDFTILDDHVGITTDVAVNFDNAQLSRLTARGSVTLDDGSTDDVDVAWTATSPISRFGNDGPDFLPFRHYVDRCTTTNAHAHETFVRASMAGTLNGLPVHSYQVFDVATYIARSHYLYMTVSHAGAC